MGLDKFIFNLNGKSIDLSKLQGGININSVDKKLASIFRALDINANSVIEDAEILIESGSKEDILAKLKDENLVEKLKGYTEKLSYNLQDL